jgi:hypothetical protein
MMYSLPWVNWMTVVIPAQHSGASFVIQLGPAARGTARGACTGASPCPRHGPHGAHRRVHPPAEFIGQFHSLRHPSRVHTR